MDFLLLIALLYLPIIYNIHRRLRKIEETLKINKNQFSKSK